MATQISAEKSQNAIDLLLADHNKSRADFKKYETLGEKDYEAKKKLSDEICSDLLKHMVAEEELFYPAVQPKIHEGKDLVQEGVVEHSGAKDLIHQIQSMSADEELFDAKVKVLAEQIEHHVSEEEEDMFPQAKKVGIDLVALGSKIAERKKEVSA